MSKPLQDIVKEAQRIVDEAERRGITLRLFGGMAIRFRCPSATHRGLQRKYADIDFMGLSKQSKEIKRLFTELGYAPDKSSTLCKAIDDSYSTTSTKQGG